MSASAMNSMQRVLTTLGHKEPDRVPLFLFMALQGARELNLSILDYFSKAEHVIEGQLRLRTKFGHDCLFGFCYGPLEIEAWGGEVIFSDDGPPNSGAPFIDNIEKIPGLKVPDPAKNPHLVKTLRIIEGLKNSGKEECPVIGVVMSPFSLPVMQMGFGPYIELMLERPELFWKLMEINEAFCVQWANAQLAAGATAICYFDPLSSSTIIPRHTYLETGFVVARRTLAKIKGPTVTHMASGRALPILNDIAQTGTAGVGVSSLEDLAEIKKICRGKLTVIGNLNGIEMRRWSKAEAEEKVRKTIAQGGAGGGFILSDNHGEIPWQVGEETLTTIAEATRRWGIYPLGNGCQR